MYSHGMLMFDFNSKSKELPEIFHYSQSDVIKQKDSKCLLTPRTITITITIKM